MELKENKIEILRINNENIKEYTSISEKINILFKKLEDYKIVGEYKLENNVLRFLFVKIIKEKVINVRAIFSEEEFNSLSINNIIEKILKFFN